MKKEDLIRLYGDEEHVNDIEAWSPELLAKVLEVLGGIRDKMRIDAGDDRGYPNGNMNIGPNWFEAAYEDHSTGTTLVRLSIAQGLNEDKKVYVDACVYDVNEVSGDDAVVLSAAKRLECFYL